MRYHVLACDYDGTLALHGKVDGDTLAALERLLASGRKLVLVTGRELDELLGIFPEINLFEWVVAENGAVLYRPGTREERLLAETPPGEFVRELRRRGVAPLSVGRIIVSTWQPHEAVVLDTIRAQGLGLQVIFNKDAVMVLPQGVTKATGLAVALGEMGLSPHEAVAIGDAENDHAFLSQCECAVAVANGLPAVRERADLVTRGDHGAGVAELIERLIDNDLIDLEPRLERHNLLLGTGADDRPVYLSPYGPSVLIAGPSGSGKSTAATSLLERLSEKQYQFCIVDPEGDYENLAGAVTLGSAQRGPAVQEVLDVLAKPDQQAVINLVGLPLADRPTFFIGLLPRLLEMRTKTGRPHWLIVDEAHHLLPASWEPGALALPAALTRAVFITVHPDQVVRDVMAQVGTAIAVGADASATLRQLCEVVDAALPDFKNDEPEAGEVLLWERHAGTRPYRVKLAPSTIERRRHTRKYAEGELPPDRSFYFRGPEDRLNLRAQNLLLFLQLADGVDDETWSFHLQEGDYSRWFRERIKNETLADEAAEIEGKAESLSPRESRNRIRQAIERHYTVPESTPLPMPGTDAAPSYS